MNGRLRVDGIHPIARSTGSPETHAVRRNFRRMRASIVDAGMHVAFSRTAALHPKNAWRHACP
ncbi:hypothetical protein, partial [Burkholderia cepacia]|uniref:hypothetical protein n=1 Tax=Burkholderia cepacia TaxID=292 RepID=UPI002AB622F2